MNNFNWKDIKGFFFDLDGVLVQNGVNIPGAVETLEFLHKRKIPFRILTNRTTQSLDTIHDYLQERGFPVKRKEIFSAPLAAVHYLRRKGRATCRLVMREDPKKDFAEFTMTRESPDYVIVGDLLNAWDYSILNEIFNLIMNGARLMALHKGRYWIEETGLHVDIGVFIAGLEYVSGKEALVMGKPSPDFFNLALEDIKLEPRQVAMVGDDILADISGAQRMGINGVLVLSGKYAKEHDHHYNVAPDVILPTMSEIPNLV
ncbi:TIGR01458 family HAD-type hydrolase [Candidatus Sumerlaeota bacterium]|nr:TIGR01458 family HAD-type hydrolase [Candidatus Sumerlaeota bacterium]